MAIAVLSCTSPTKDFDIHISPTFYKYVIEVELFDITNPNATFTGKPTIEITGADAAGIYNIDGTKNFDINFGSLQLIVERNLEPTAADPIDVIVKFSSNIYQSTSLPISIGVEDYFLKYDVGLLDLTNLPTGITNSSKTGAVGTNGQLTQPVTISAGSNDSVSKIVLTVPNDITFEDASGNAVTGSQLDVDVLSFSDTTAAGQAALPNGGGLFQQVMVNGVVDEEILDPAATFKIDMSMGGSSVTKFSGNGITMKIDVPNILYNYEEDRAYQAGDSVSLLSISDGSSSWSSDGNFLVQADAQGNLFFDAQVNHLSFFRCNRRRRRATNSFTNITVDASLPSGTSNSVSGNIELLLKITRSGITRTISKVRLPRTITNAQGRIFSRRIRYYPSSNPTYTAEVGSRGTLKEPLFNFSYSHSGRSHTDIVVTPTGSGVSVSFSLYCEGDATVITPPAGVKMFFRPNGVPNAIFQHLYTFTNANIGINTGRIYQLDDNVKYDFRALFGDEQIDTNNVLVEDGKHYQVILPQAACNELF